MKVLIAVGMVIIFISVFFMLFIFDSLVKQGGACVFGFGECATNNPGFSLVFGIILIAFFVVVDAVAIYLVFVNAIKAPTYRALIARV